MTRPSNQHPKPAKAVLENEAAREGPEESPQGIFCRHGIFSGRFPIAGLRLGEVRPVLSRLLNIDPEAAAVVDGRLVGDDFLIGDDVELLNFIKPSGIMG